MKKYFKPDLLPFIPGVLGALAMMCQLWLHLLGIDEKGLYISGHTANTLSFLLLAATIVVAWLCSRPLVGRGADGPFPQSILGGIGSILGGLGLLLSVLLEELAYVASRFEMINIVLGCIAGAALVIAGILRLLGKPCHYAIHGAALVYFLVHLIARYRLWSTEPALESFFFPLLASSALTLTVFQHANLDGGYGDRRMYVFTNQLALFCCMASVNSTHPIFYLSMMVWCLTGLCDLRAPVMFLPQAVHECMDTLLLSGYQAYVVGGCVRDSLLDQKPHDYDLCTDATPEEIVQAFDAHQLIRNGEKHGTIGVVINNQVYEITTFRTEGTYSDSRHPDSVSFVRNVKKDLARRDFTINAMAYAPDQGFIDPFGGSSDLIYGVLKAVGRPETRFREDALRILRGVRFALRFRLTPDPDTLKAMLKLAPSLDQLASERVFSELCGILPLVTAADLKLYAPILMQVIPELRACENFNQHSHHHAYDVYTHTAYVTEAVGPQLALRLAALLHDIGKPTVFYLDEAGAGHFPEHARVGAEKADEILRRLKAPTALREQVVFLVAHHMTPFQTNRTLLRRRLSKYGEENCRLLLQLQKADFCSKGVQGERPDYETIEKMLDEILQEAPCLQPKDLAIGGKELMELGFEPGPKLGQALEALLSLVVDEVLPNEPAALLEKAKELMEVTQ